jgi:hypothetical protein
MTDPVSEALKNLVAAIEAIERMKARERILESLNGSDAPVAKWQTRAERTAKPPAKRAKGEKRNPDDLAKTVELLATYIRQFPGRSIEVIGTKLHIPTKDLTLPIKKLLVAKRIRTTGQKRATKYFPRG